MQAAQRPNSPSLGPLWRSLAIVSCGLIVAAAILMATRFQLVASDGGIYRLDRITGAVHMCLPMKNHAFDLACSGEFDDWAAVPKK